MQISVNSKGHVHHFMTDTNGARFLARLLRTADPTARIEKIEDISGMADEEVTKRGRKPTTSTTGAKPASKEAKPVRPGKGNYTIPCPAPGGCTKQGPRARRGFCEDHKGLFTRKPAAPLDPASPEVINMTSSQSTQKEICLGPGIPIQDGIERWTCTKCGRGSIAVVGGQLEAHAPA